MYLKLIRINVQNQIKQCQLQKKVILTGSEFPLFCISSCLMSTCFISLHNYNSTQWSVFLCQGQRLSLSTLMKAKLNLSGCNVCENGTKFRVG